ncbi:hypothetical protein GCM10010168_79360 [Actinoplanes ianthinogenes]|uniref:Uncharacterized protein n=1 Tax=Actinoplanes ianthinogenes TaxID=122358 RepID=A0ABM7LK35_9ACTN|nr:hypothetical protein [Actinoplanes ianthinogenes]BCJ39609.1 hypothetical protein Aiant_02660 [Actinoplanes ianthinogenes]GGR48571.1 hypothetical protein GCM10010168_79360 [Actinoplanes ianthinogenes]
MRDFTAAAFPGTHPLSQVIRGYYRLRDADRRLQAGVLRRCAYRAVRDDRRPRDGSSPLERQRD